MNLHKSNALLMAINEVFPLLSNGQSAEQAKIIV
jgi:hypothetical protein